MIQQMYAYIVKLEAKLENANRCNTNFNSDSDRSDNRPASRSANNDTQSTISNNDTVDTSINKNSKCVSDSLYSDTNKESIDKEEEDEEESILVQKRVGGGWKDESVGL